MAPHTGVVDDLVGKSRLGEGELLATLGLAEVDAKESKDVAAFFQSQIVTQIFELANILFNDIVIRAKPNLVIAIIQHHDL